MEEELKNYPEFLMSHHLVELGLYGNLGAVRSARWRGSGPDYIKLQKKILYPKKNLIKFLQSRMKMGSVVKVIEESEK